jgi:biopolymer transport protein ExbD
MQQGGGLIIRLIDVVLNILFGFIIISDFGLKTQIKLDSGKAAESKKTVTYIYNVQVLNDGGFTLENSTNQQTFVFSIPRANAIAELERFLFSEFTRNRAEQNKMIVVLRSDPSTKIQYIVDVLDICEKHKIPRSISY